VKLTEIAPSLDVQEAWQAITTPPARPLSKKQRQKSPQGVVIVLASTSNTFHVPSLAERNVKEPGKAKVFGKVWITSNNMAFIGMCQMFIENGGGLKNVPYRFLIFGDNGDVIVNRSFAEIYQLDTGDLCRMVPHDLS
jgi:hypothetical protein